MIFLPPVEELGRTGQRARRTTVSNRCDRSPGGSVTSVVGAEPADLGEAELPAADQDAEVTRSEQRRELANRHLVTTVSRRRAIAQRPSVRGGHAVPHGGRERRHRGADACVQSADRRDSGAGCRGEGPNAETELRLRALTGRSSTRRAGRRRSDQPDRAARIGAARTRAVRSPVASSRRAAAAASARSRRLAPSARRTRPAITGNMDVRRETTGDRFMLAWDTAAAVAGWEVRLSEREGARGAYLVRETLALPAPRRRRAPARRPRDAGAHSRPRPRRPAAPACSHLRADAGGLERTLAAPRERIVISCRPTPRTSRTHAAARLRDPRRAASARSGRAA